ncbi:protein kinase [Streptomyces sp. NPDC056672]|uniref:protein kinase domain-containing protein n=1 Tax=Streptomyces sp. NPDC056672 TaxID=3345906 RepID=UPI003691D8C2
MNDTPHDLPKSIVDTIQPFSQKLVLHRRGSTVWKVDTDQGQFAVKLGWPILATEQWPAQEWTARAPAREGAILQQLGPERVSHGVWEGGTWNIQPWRPGVDLWKLWEHHRSGEPPLPPTMPNLDDALSCAEALELLHQKGVVHGDVQPAHFILGRTGTFLIDLALAQGAEIPDEYDFPYRGCLVHYEAPEISRSVLENGTATPTMASDLYALGAALFISATGWRHVEYPDDASRPEQRKAIAEKPHRPVTVPGVLGKLIEEMLRPNPGDRPTCAEICADLRS